MVRSSSAISLYGVGMTNVASVYGKAPSGFVSALGGNAARCIECLPAVPFATSMAGFVSFLETLRSSINTYFPSNPLVTKMAVGGTMNTSMFARLMWGQKYKETYGAFDGTSVIHVTLLKDIFLELGTDWTTDAWLRDWQPPIDTPPTDMPLTDTPV